MTYRARNILIAVVLAGVAALLTVFYVSNYKSNVRSDAETISVLVAAQDIPQGMLGSQVVAQKMLTTQEIPRKAIVNGTISRPEDISGLIATQPIYIGEQVTARRFGPLEAAGVRDQLQRHVARDPDQGQPEPDPLGRPAPGRPRRLRRQHQVPGGGQRKALHEGRAERRPRAADVRRGRRVRPLSSTRPAATAGSCCGSRTRRRRSSTSSYANNDWWLALRPGLNDANSRDEALIADASEHPRRGPRSQQRQVTPQRVRRLT